MSAVTSSTSPNRSGDDDTCCVVVIPFLNEHRHLQVFLDSLDAQERRPDLAVLVDDGSSDGSGEIAETFAAAREWVRVLYRPPRPAARDRLDRAPELAAFLWAVDQLEAPFDVIAKMDADLQLSPKAFRTVLDALAADRRLGIAGIFLTAVAPDGSAYVEDQRAEHVRGATRFYRRECFEDVSPIPQMLGWDGADLICARAHGWRTESFELGDEVNRHLRPTGAHDGRLRARLRWGRCAYAFGAHPVAILVGAFTKPRRSPVLLGSAAYIAGWLGGYVRREPRAPAHIRAAAKREHRARIRAALQRRVGRARSSDAPAIEGR